MAKKYPTTGETRGSRPCGLASEGATQPPSAAHLYALAFFGAGYGLVRSGCPRGSREAVVFNAVDNALKYDCG